MLVLVDCRALNWLCIGRTESIGAGVSSLNNINPFVLRLTFFNNVWK